VLCSNGSARLTDDERGKLARFGIELYEKKIAKLEGDSVKLESIVFEDGTAIRRTAMFFSTGNVQRSKLPNTIGCAITHKGAIRTNRSQQSSVPGVWVCGDACEDADYAIIAAAGGAKAAMGINKELQAEDQA
jgi:thioredoxin reductase